MAGTSVAPPWPVPSAGGASAGPCPAPRAGGWGVSVARPPGRAYRGGRRTARGALQLEPAGPNYDGRSPRAVRLPNLPANSRKYASLLPPLWERRTAVYQLCKGVWYFEQPFSLGTGDIRMRMTVVRLKDGSLWVHSPVALTEECRRALAAIGGQVSHIVVPSLAPQHWLYAAVYSKYFPSAEVWVPPGLLELQQRMGALESFGITELSHLAEVGPRVMEPTAPDAWRADISVAMFSCPVYVETAFCLVRHGVLVTSDFCLGADTDPQPAGAQGFFSWETIASAPLKMAAMAGRLGSPVAYPIFQANKEEALAWIVEISEMDFDIVLPAHFDAPIFDGKRKFFKCFEYVLEWDKRGRSDSVI